MHLALARRVAEDTLEQGVCLYTQWFPGKDNWVADLLSRYFKLSHHELTQFILSNAPYSQQVPANFKVRALRDLLLATASAASHGVTTATSQKSNTAWKRWIQFLHTLGLPNDPFLDGFDRGQRHRLLGTFAQSVRNCTYSKSTQGNAELVEGTCRTTVGGVAEAFKAARGFDPRLDSDGKASLLSTTSLQRIQKPRPLCDPADEVSLPRRTQAHDTAPDHGTTDDRVRRAHPHGILLYHAELRVPRRVG
jgi:hypothetical protein